MLLERDVGDDFERLAHVVENQHRVGQHQVEVGRAEFVVRMRGQALEVAHDVVGEKADRAAEEARQLGRLIGAKAAHLVAQSLERTLDRAHLDAASRPREVQPPAPPAQHHRGLRTEKSVAPPLLAALHALEQKGVVAARDLEKGADRSLEVGGNLAPDRNQVVALRGQGLELALVWLKHRSLPKPSSHRTSKSESETSKNEKRKGPLDSSPAAPSTTLLIVKLRSRSAGERDGVPPPTRSSLELQGHHFHLHFS